MKLAGVRTVVFDLDDTLYPERDYTRSGIRAAARHFAGELGEAETARQLLELERMDPAGPIYSRWLEQRGLDAADWLPKLLRVHRAHQPRLQLEPSVRRTLVRMRKSYALGLISDGRLEQQRAKADALGLHDLLDAMVFSDELGRERWKPHPAPYWKALERLGARPSETVYVGDNPAKDFLGARRAGLRSIRLRRPEGLHAATEPACPDAAPAAEIEDLAALESLLAS